MQIHSALEDAWMMGPEDTNPGVYSEVPRMQDVSRLLSGHRDCCPTCCQRSDGRHRDDVLHYACTDVVGPPRPTMATAAMHSEDQAGQSSSWEVTRKPKIRTRASDWI